MNKVKVKIQYNLKIKNIAALLQDDSSESETDSDGMANIANVIFKLKKKNKKTVKVSASDSYHSKPKAKVKAFSKLLKALNGRIWLAPVVSSITLMDKGESKLDEVINQLSDLIEKWNPPKVEMPSLALMHRITYLCEEWWYEWKIWIR